MSNIIKPYYLLLLISFNIFSQNQEKNSTATYVSSIHKELGSKSTNTDVINQFNKSIKDKEAYFDLIFNKRESYYSMQTQMSDTNDFKQKIANIFFGDGTSSYVKRDSKESVNLVEAYGEKFLIPIQKWKWVLTQEKKIISNYICFKAKTSYIVKNSKGDFVKNVVAWYSPEINYPFGPKDFNGLPGLILELYDSNLKYVIKELSFKNTSKRINKPTRGKKISQEEFYEIGIKMDGGYSKKQ